MIGHVEVVTLALFLLGGDRSAIDTEDIAKKANELAPGRFVWKKYSDQINLEMVRVSLSDAKKEANGSRVDGSGRTGWVLTEAGRRWASTEGSRVLNQGLSRDRLEGRGGGIDERRWRAERARILALEAWGEWSRQGDVSPFHAAEVFRLDVYATVQLRSQKVTRLMGLFDGDEEITPFLRAASLVLEKDPRREDK
jgi:hypothetical protein